MTDAALARRTALSLLLVSLGVDVLGHQLAGVRKAQAAVDAGSPVGLPTELSGAWHLRAETLLDQQLHLVTADFSPALTECV